MDENIKAELKWKILEAAINIEVDRVATKRMLAQEKWQEDREKAKRSASQFSVIPDFPLLEHFNTENVLTIADSLYEFIDEGSISDVQ